MTDALGNRHDLRVRRRGPRDEANRPAGPRDDLHLRRQRQPADARPGRGPPAAALRRWSRSSSTTRAGRVTKTTYPDGSTTQTVYNSIGKQADDRSAWARDDVRLRRIGRLVRTTFPDGTREESTYDAEGRRLTSTDRAGRVTQFDVRRARPRHQDDARRRHVRNHRVRPHRAGHRGDRRARQRHDAYATTTPAGGPSDRRARHVTTLRVRHGRQSDLDEGREQPRHAVRVRREQPADETIYPDGDVRPRPPTTRRAGRSPSAIRPA